MLVGCRGGGGCVAETMVDVDGGEYRSRGRGHEIIV